MTWITAAAGFGKTTLLQRYEERLSSPVLHYTMRKGRTDPDGFFHDIRDLAIKVHGVAAKALPLLTSEYFHELENFTQIFFTRLQSLSATQIFIIDDYHNLQADGPLDQLLAAAAEHFSEGGLRLIVASREDFSANWSLLYAARKIIQLDEDTLALTEAETKKLFALYPNLETDHIEQAVQTLLCGGLEGWVTGVILIAERLSQRPDLRTQSNVDHTRQALFGYFLSQIFGQMSPQTRHVMLVTCLLPAVPCNLAIAYSGDESALEILEGLISHRLVIRTTRKVAEQDLEFFQYHDLILEFLRSVAEQELAAEERRSLQSRGAAMLLTVGQLEEAAQLFTVANDWDGLSNFVKENADHLVNSGRNSVLQQAIAALPDELLAQDPGLTYWRAVCRMSEDSRDAIRLLAVSYDLFKKKKNALGMSMAWCSLIDAIWMVWDDFHTFDHWIKEYFTHLADQRESLPLEIVKRNARGIFAALSLRCPDHPAFARCEADVRRHLLTPLDPNDRIFFSIQLLYYYVFIKGDRQESTSIVTALEVGGHDNPAKLSPIARIFLYDCKSSHAVHFGSTTEEVYEIVDQGLAAADETGIHVWDAGLLTAALNTAYASEDISRAQTYMERFRAVENKKHSGFEFLTRIYASYEAWLLDRHDDAAAHARQTLEVAEINGGFNVVLCALIPLAAILRDTGKSKEAWLYAVRARRMARSGGSKVKEYAICMIMAQICLDKGCRRRAVAYLSRARGIVERERYLSVPWLRPSQLADLIGLSLAEFGPSAYFADMVSTYGISPPRDPSLREIWPWRCCFYFLGDPKIMVNGENILEKNKIPRQLLRLLRVLAFAGPSGMNQDQLRLAVWPDGDPDKVYSVYKTSLHRLRRLLGSESAILVRGGKVRLSDDYCWVDIWSFNGLIEAPAKDLSDSVLEQACQIYRGGLFLEANDINSAHMLRDSLEIKFSELVEELAERKQTAGELDNACNLYRRLLEMDSSHEVAYQGLMRCLAASGRRRDLERTYQNCLAALREELEVEPSESTQILYSQLMEQIHPQG